MKYLIANWKAHKSIKEVDVWIREFTLSHLSAVKDNLEIIICPPYPFIYFLKERLKTVSFCKIGAQDVSYFGSGAYTGEVAADNLTGLVDYVLVGHSERRQYFSENSRILFQKANRVIEQNIMPIFCIRDIDDPIPSEVRFVAYEPITSIGTGKNESLAEVLSVKKRLHLDEKIHFIYGGSISEDSISEYSKSSDLDGFLVGSASLQADSFSMMTRHILQL